MKNPITEFLDAIAIDHRQFHPRKEFYKTTGIGQRRWGQLLSGDKSATFVEMKAIADYFGQDVSVLANIKQLKFFDEDGNQVQKVRQLELV